MKPEIPSNDLRTPSLRELFEAQRRVAEHFAARPCNGAVSWTGENLRDRAGELVRANEVSDSRERPACWRAVLLGWNVCRYYLKDESHKRECECVEAYIGAMVSIGGLPDPKSEARRA